MAMIARALALRGECLFLIRDRLIPCTDWDLSTRYGQPRAYRVGLPEIGGGRNETVLAGEVLHFRIGCDATTPWAGSAPLARARLSAGLLDEITTAMRDVFRDAPIGSQIIPVPEGSQEDMADLRAGFKGRRGASLLIEGVAAATAAGMNPQIGQRPDQLSPNLKDTLADKLLTEAKGEIYGVFGILPGLVNPSTTGPMVREAQRHLAQLVLQPIANLLAEEASEKLGDAVTIDVVRPMQAFDHGGKARAFGAMLQAMAAAKEAGLDGATLLDAQKFIDWQE
ncbi:phage portal protein [Paracoccus amoyensis]|uniref:phage portal protein n=1 Tax=Paracoccus amoyensis TaxID=2760093 RepID=UPI001FE5B265|nr:phage portal protein [Paracoccus amoyensis]